MSDVKPPGLSRPSRWMVLFLAGPVVWYLYFWWVYLVAEAGCTLGAGRFRIFGFPGVSVVTAASTLLAVAVVIWAAGSAWRSRAERLEGPGEAGPEGQHAKDRREARGFLLLGGILLGLVSLLATLFTGLPALVLSPC